MLQSGAKPTPKFCKVANAMSRFAISIYVYYIYICYIQNHLALYIFNSDSANYCSKMEVLSEKNATNPN